MGLFDNIKKKNNSDNVVWRNVNGEIVCPGDACPQECDNRCPIFRNTVALALMRIDSNKKALEVFEEILQMAPDFDEVYNNMAAIYGGEGRYQEAYDCYLKAHELNNVRPNPIYGLALCCRDLNRPEECIKWCEEYSRFATDNCLDKVYAEMKAKLGMLDDIEDEDDEDEMDYEIIQEGDEWTIIMKEDYYFFIDEDGDYATTPRGALLETSYLELAERILEDLDEYGPYDFSAESILPWHYTMVENFSKMEHKEVEAVLADSFVNRHDWTYTVDAEGSELEDIWGERGVRETEIMEWLSKITHMQMTAACCIGNAYHSLNIAYMAAIIMEKTYDEDERDDMFAELTGMISGYSEFDSSMDDFENFALYYGIHLEENGKVITK